MKRVILPLLVLFGISMLFALESEPSDVVGYIQYTVATNNYGFVALPFGTTMVDASDLATDMGTDISSISYWDNGWHQWLVGNPGVFDVYADHSYLVKNANVSSPVTWYIEGTVGTPASFDIVGGNFTQIMLPLDCSDLNLASLLAADIGPDVTSISAWNGGWQQYIVGNPGDFSVEIGQGILINSTTEYLGWNGTVRTATRNEANVTSKSNSKKQ